ncbi:triple tyrosine motif-containing protein [Paraflavitalea sp. CAU 1676]|uniref:triple tyrosine motif-containing protein n=1 Tax=Paraflavitalea sp. CAU 1676 TaxID=3032598 RepID=UPI0023DA8EB0|nr:triple tyrosine motif-containing protein [Paraflavitalea sp. CAU 1676]MDF2192116.1 triple tyrosine motif-containing protein [Paraflavitalea sp. CAU 1676]
MRLLLLLCYSMSFTALFAQNTIGFPDIINYPKEQYRGGGQNWDVAIDQRGLMYFANTEGLLTYDGQYWKLYPIANHTRLRSVKVDERGYIFVGAQDELGYYFPDRNGALQYHSLRHLVPANSGSVADVWDIELHDNAVFYRLSNMVLEYRDGTIKVHAAPREWRKMYHTRQGLYAQDIRDGLMKYEAGVWKTAVANAAIGDKLITGLLDGPNGSLLIVSHKDGLFRLKDNQLVAWKTEGDAIFAASRIYGAITLNETEMAVGTTSNGCYIINKENGRIVQHFSMEEGLQNNNVLRLFADSRQNIWLALDNGIDFIRYNTFIKQIYPDKKNMLTTYAAQVYDRKLYVGTSDGLYSTPICQSSDFSFSKNHFQQVRNSKGQVWNLSVVNNQLLMGHHEGTFVVSGNNAAQLITEKGCWLYKPFSATGSPYQMLIGAYNGLYGVQSGTKGFMTPAYLGGLKESLRFLAVDNEDTIWASHPYRGVYKLSLQGNSVHYTLFTSKNGLPSDYDNFVYRIRNRVVVATSQGIYEFNSAANRFEKSALLYDVLGNTSVQFLTEDANGNIWFTSKRRPGIIDFHKPSGKNAYSLIYFPELQQKIVNGFEFIYPYDDENIFMAAEKGLYHINYRKYIQSAGGPAVTIGAVRAMGKSDSLLFGGYYSNGQVIQHQQTDDALAELPNGYNDFHFEFASPAFDQGSNVEYSYRLAGINDGWSEWTAKTEKDYTNLPYGNYTFSVKARNNVGIESAEMKYSFTILPAFYQTRFAKAIYGLLFLSLLFLIYRRQKQKFAMQQQKYQQKQEHLISLHQLELERNEKELIKVQNDKLASDVNFKNRELATVTMHLVDRGRVLSNIKEVLNTTIKKLEPTVTQEHFKRVMRLFEEAENNDEDWEHFSKHFDEVHSNFLARVKKYFPSLTTTDLKLCAYLHIDLTSKEIAQLLGISVRGVETSRYRLRKKLNIPGEISLNAYLLEAIEGDYAAHRASAAETERMRSVPDNV